MSAELPSLPTEPESFLSYIGQNDDKPVRDLLQPYLEYERKLRGIFAQDPSNPVLENNVIGLVPIYDGHDEHITIKARDLETESEETKGCYILPLNESERKAANKRAIVDRETFQKNFDAFTEGSLKNLNWSHIVAAGSSVMTPLLSVPKKHTKTNETLRNYYHNKLAPTSDIDLFIYGTKDEKLAIKRIEAIEKTIIKNLGKDEVLSVRTKNTITIVSKYPHRHVQIVLRLYSSISEILTGFDVSCACAAYDGQQVYANPRAIVSWMLQCNDIDLSRRSPSYEHRLNKYRKRGFEVYYAGLDRKIIDPTIFERNMRGIKGLAKLLVLERLPTEVAQENYFNMRRKERNRPGRMKPKREKKVLQGDLKGEGNDIPDWGITIEKEESQYETIAIPYGPRFDAARIKTHLFQSDMFLNSEWNTRMQKRRGAYFHRHPAFFGTVRYIIKDCCGYCPIADPNNTEDVEMQRKDDRYYIRGKISFLKDDPGRQEIGSFNPLTDEDWTDQAYLSVEESLRRAIVTNDEETIKAWLENNDVNKRDYTGRTPLHLAALASSPKIVQLLLDAGARISPRIMDGRTALHVAAVRGDSEIVKMILLKNQENEQLKDEREQKETKEKEQGKSTLSNNDGEQDPAAPSTEESQGTGEDAQMTEGAENGVNSAENGGDGEDKDGEDMTNEAGDKGSDEDVQSDDDLSVISTVKEGSVSARTGVSGFVDVHFRSQSEDPELGLEPEEEKIVDDIIDINKPDWDYQLSPLHYAVLHGHKDIVVLLVSEFGADVLQPVITSYNSRGVPDSVLPTLCLVFEMLVKEEKAPMFKTLLKLGASSAQTDMDGVSVLMRAIQTQHARCLKAMFKEDSASAVAAAKYLHIYQNERVSNALLEAIHKRNEDMVMTLLKNGVPPEITLEAFTKAAKPMDRDRNRFLYYNYQPAEMALELEMPEIFAKCIELGVDPSSYTAESRPEEDEIKHFLKRVEGESTDYYRKWDRRYLTYVDLLEEKIKDFERALAALPDCEAKEEPETTEESTAKEEVEDYSWRLKKLVSIPAELSEDSYEYWMASQIIEKENKRREEHNDGWHKAMKPKSPTPVQKHDPEKVKEKRDKLEQFIGRYRELVDLLISKGGKRYKDLHPEIWNSVFAPKPEEKKEDNPTPASQTPAEKPAEEEKKPAVDTWELEFTYKLERGKTLDTRINNAYHELYKAVWNGDKEGVKKYTTTNWEEDMAPLLLATENQLKYTPLSIAIYRKHPHEFLDLILTIIDAQYNRDHPQDAKKVTEKIYELNLDSTFVVEEFDFTEVKLISNITDEQVTEDIVKAKYSAASVLRRSVPHVFSSKSGPQNSLLGQALEAGDKAMVTYILSRTEVFGGPKTEPGTYQPDIRRDDALNNALKDQNIELLEDLMEKYGTGAMFDGVDDFKYEDSDDEDDGEDEGSVSSGDAMDDDEGEKNEKDEEIKEVKRPKQYLGLSVDGKKQKEWAQAMNPNQPRWIRKRYQEPPLALFAAYHGSHKVFEWLESKGPENALRRWQTKLEKADDAKKSYFLKVLEAANEETFRSWMGVEHPLLLHAVIKNNKIADSPDLSEDEKFEWYEKNVEFFVSKNPELLECRKNNLGYTPLMLAAYNGNKYALKALLKVGADPYSKTPEQNFNIIHLIIWGYDQSGKYSYKLQRRQRRNDWQSLKDCLSMLPEDVRKWAFSHRGRENGINYTPLAYAISSLRVDNPKLIKLLLKVSGGADTRIRTSLGDLPVHTIVKLENVNLLQCILDASPLETSIAENTDGATALEMAALAWYKKVVRCYNIRINYFWDRINKPDGIADKKTLLVEVKGDSDNHKQEDEDEDEFTLRSEEWGIGKGGVQTAKVLHMLQITLRRAIDGGHGERTLVSLAEVNEVAERLLNKKRSSYSWREGGDYDDIVKYWDT